MSDAYVTVQPLVDETFTADVRRKSSRHSKQPSQLKSRKTNWQYKQSKSDFVFAPTNVNLDSTDSSPESVFQSSYSFVVEEMRERYGQVIEYLAKRVPVESIISEIVESGVHSDRGFAHMDLGQVISQAIRWKRALPRVHPFYAMKSCPDRNVVRTLHLLGVNFDCASKGEIEVALEVGADPTQIIYANPSKGPDHIRYAREKDVRLMTFDNIAELEKILANFPDAELVLRTASNDSLSVMPFGYKFGASYEDALALILACKQLNAKLVGVSFHVAVDATLRPLSLIRSR
jgi:hypothetical protein